MGKHVLVVDDSPEVRLSLKDLLSSEQVLVHSACDGAEGLDATRERSYDLVICDVNMPRMNGLEMLKNMREKSLNQATPIFVLTTESLKTHQDDYEKLKAQTWIVKPYNPTRLLEIVRVTLERAAP
ncbi:MAG: response regulator [Myxococcota bacterium]|nr:response regulator [Myxococcota bacterium]